MDKPDYYEVLGIGRDAHLEEIKSAFRREAFRWHPDRNHGDPVSERRFKAAFEAYEVLRDPKKRSLYDLGWDAKHAEIAFSGFGRGGRRGNGCGRGHGRGCARRFQQPSWAGGWGGSFYQHIVDVTLDPIEATNGCEREIAYDSIFGRSTLLFRLPPGLKDGDVVLLNGSTREVAQGLGGSISLRVKVAP